MPTTSVNSVRLLYELTGDSGPPLVLVHGSWADHTIWDPIVPALAQRFRVLTYDRRGHSQSERPPGQGSVAEDADDLAALIEQLELGPAHIAGNSFGGTIVLRFAARRPDLIRSVAAHEPPLFGLLATDPDHEPAMRDVQARAEAVADRLATGNVEEGTRQFMETITFGPGAWDQFPPELQQQFVANAPTFLDEVREPEALSLDPDNLADLSHRVLLTKSDQSPSFFPPVVATLNAALPHTQTQDFPGTGHVPHLDDPETFVATVTDFAAAADTARPS